ncbi:TKL protein kinase [Thecamonas trahens ATCC 50062]|uniref:TKL protein kinase n=1 Tax=Thecamonas trahens ATCC 50062 TaxID=461836 RepID=A0A0L0DRB2_THETB|nr:TKL protein kinase [Thecamonas trahens ATCC 50062]KNC54854.1 TKL protein kinase [Thecamonas trahens ATCC 50062]|eukprot:XP_013761751.1 TKL protein kinase [Thecamonas trahens ATCC 50062]
MSQVTSLRECTPADVDKYVCIPVDERIAIRKFVVDRKGLTWVRGSALYQFTKTELVQVYKRIVARDDVSGVLYEGEALRALLGFRTADGAEINALRLKPKSFPGITLFIQSTSVNRVLLPDTTMLYEASPEDRQTLGFRPADALVNAKELRGSQSRMKEFLATEGASSSPPPPSLTPPPPSGTLQRSPMPAVAAMGQPPPNTLYAAPGTPPPAPPLPASLAAVPVSAWSVANVVEWLEWLGLGNKLGAAFVAADIDGEVLAELTDDELRDELGCTLGMAKKLARARVALFGGGYASPTLSSPLPAGGASEVLSPGDAVEYEQPAWEIPMADLTKIEMVGSGAFGQVFRGKWRGAPVAIKMLSMRTLDAQQLDDFRREAAIMTQLEHPHVVSMMGISSQPPDLAIIVEFCPGGSLDKYLFDPSIELSDWHKLKLVRGIAAGMTYLTSAGVVHRDLAARNILVTEDGEAKISDFGMSRADLMPKNTTESAVGPLKWMAPEALARSYSEKTDVWAFGVTLWEIVNRSLPFPELNNIEVAAGVLHNGLRLPIYPDTLPEWSAIMVACWAQDPAARPSFAQISEHVESLWAAAAPAPVPKPAPEPAPEAAPTSSA